ncbi:unnamed protein product [Linum trigynum]|uniref:Gnk2-homologous domain-containing protein n=1 Tax=Linum trigynum TaxID=586398 RepID=A0AAV2F6K5_9ROSI
MPYSTLSFPAFLIITTLLLTFQLRTVAGDPLFHFCSSPQNFTQISPYQSNLQTLFTQLADQAPPAAGFAKASIGHSPIDRVNGLALCRGDVDTNDCKTCVLEASREISRRCPLNKGSVIWYDSCLLKYSDEDFLGQVDNGDRFYMWNVNVVADPAAFNGKAKELLSQLAKLQAPASSKLLYAVGETEVTGGGGSDKKMLYGLVQCTRDLSKEDCESCLGGIIGELPSCCDGKEGGRVVGGSCNFRYEIYPFVGR